MATKKRVNGKAKGKGWERDVANYLSELYGESFRRVPNSGAFIGGKNAFRKDTMSDSQILLSKGDIIPPDNMKHFVIECKSYADFPFHKFPCDTPIKILDDWISQVKHDCDEGDFWMLLIKISRKGEFVVIENFPRIVHAHVNYGGVYAVVEKEMFFSVYKDWIFKMVETKKP